MCNKSFTEYGKFLENEKSRSGIRFNPNEVCSKCGHTEIENEHDPNYRGYHSAPDPDQCPTCNICNPRSPYSDWLLLKMNGAEYFSLLPDKQNQLYLDFLNR